LGKKSSAGRLEKLVVGSKDGLKEATAFEEISAIRKNLSWVSVAHTCNPSCSGGRDQEDQGLKPAQANS
jgi:hypothetical protein